MAILNLTMLGGVLVNLWVKVINFLNNSIGNYAWAIILLTVVIKLAMSPLDFFNKKTSRKNAVMQAKIQPELQKLQAKYGNDKNLYNQKVNELYKKENYNVVGSCLFMFVNLALTCVVFFSLLSGINTMASNKIVGQYETLKSTYNTTYQTSIDQGKTAEEAKEISNQAVEEKYQQVKYSWLWIDNVWKSDMPTNSIPTFSEYLKVAQEVKVGDEYVSVKKLSQEQKTALESEYNVVMGPLRENVGKANGYLILLVLTVGSAFLSQWLAQRKTKVQGAPTNKITMFILPIMLGVFALTYNSVFALYMLASQLITIALNPLIDFILDKMEAKKEQKKELAKAEAVPYRRVDPNVKTKQNKKGDK